MVSRDGDGALLAVRVTPRAARERVGGERAGRLLVAVTAPPAEGAANEAVCRLIARTLRVPRGAVAIARGPRSRDKVVRIDGMGPAEVARALGLAGGGTPEE